MTKSEYLELYKFYDRMSIEELSKCVSRLYKMKFEEHDTSVYEEHRIAARVLITNTKDGSGLIYHLKNIFQQYPFCLYFVLAAADSFSRVSFSLNSQSLTKSI